MGLKSIARVPFQLVFLLAQIWVGLVLSLLQRWASAVFKFLPVPALRQPGRVKTQSDMEKLKKFFRAKIAKDGEKGDKLHHVPVYQRDDGSTIKLGLLVTRVGEEKPTRTYHVKNILVREDLTTVHVVLAPIEVVARDRNLEHAEEEMMVTVQEIEISKERSISVGLARDGMKIVAETANTSPLHVQKFIRKHQLSVSMRKEVQRFLAGFSMSGSASLGCVNWQLDPVILGLERDTDFSLEHRIERAVDIITHMDLLMGRGWDVRTICGSEGYRVILTVEVLVDCNQELLMKMHGTLVSGRLDLNQYRSVSLRDTSSLHMLCNRRLSDITNNRTRRLSDVTPGQTLAWDEFQTQSAGNSPFRGVGGGASGGVPSVTVSLDDMFASGNLPNFPAASTTTFQTLETLLSQLPQSQIVFNSPIKEVSGENTGLGSSAVGPNTSTPADDLDTGDPSHHLTPHSSPSLQERQDLDEEAESLNLNKTKHADKVTFEELIPRAVGTMQKMNLSPDLEEAEDQEEGHIDSESEEGSLSVKPSPNISTDMEEVEDVSSPQRKFDPDTNIVSKQLEAEKNLQNLNVSLHDIRTRAASQCTDSPAAPSKTSISRVQEYIQSLPSPQHFIKRDQTGAGDFKPPPVFPEEDANLSFCSGSQSLLSRHSELSSLTGARMASGMFYGGQPASAALCPFPEDWQQTIPEVIENDEEID